MEYAYMVGGGAPLAKKYQIGVTMPDAGVPVIANVDGGAGVILPSTTAGVNQVGVSLDTATYVSAQQTDGTSAEREVTIIISPDAVFRALMSNGSTEGTALELFTVTQVSSSGADIITGDSFTNFDEGVIWGYDGANAGQNRKITIGDGTDATCAVPFDYATVIGDNFMRAPWWFLDLKANDITLTTLFYQVDASATVDAGLLANCVDLELRDIGQDGRTKSFLLFMWDDHLLSRTTGA
jgi:hypothetical protein